MPMKLVPFAPTHFATLAGWFASERDLVLWGGPSMTFPLDEAQLLAMLHEGRSEPPARMCWMAEQGGEFIGHVQLRLDWRHGNATLARVAIAPGARGLGHSFPMLTLAIEEAFGRPEIERVELNVYSFNTPAIRTYERFGFVREGVRRSSVRVGSERWDTVIMGLLRPRWRCVRLD